MKTGALLAVLLVVGCANSGRSPTANANRPDANLCTDEDGDGYGDGCASGGDCNDEDPAIHSGCLSCVRPAEGCGCDNSSKPVSCYLDPSLDDNGAVMCHEGTRYCRNSSWSGCESVFSYLKPKVETSPQAVITTDAGAEKCSDCRPNCFVVRDNLDPVDGGLGALGGNTIIGDGGSLTLNTYIPDTGVDAGPAYDASGCIVGTAPDKDCDGILDQYDPYPTMKPFATANPSLFLDLAPGATGTGVINLAFNLNSVDVYFLVDQTTTMTGERDNLVAGLTTGDYVNNAAYNCADYDFDHVPNNELKTKGITGAIRCYIRDANFGVGFFRELPFSHYADTTETAWRNLQDITNDVSKITTAVNKLSTNANQDYDEDAMPALYSLISGNGMYFGTDRKSVPTRSGCAANTWGYPCFRNDSIPIVLLFTDAATHAGPGPSLQRSYGSSYLGIAKANTNQSVTMVSGNESFTNGLVDAADLTNTYVSFAGDTTGMAADASAAFTCGATTSPDAFYKFSLSSSKSVTLTTAGSDIDTVLGVWSGSVPTAPTATTTPSGNDLAGSAFSFGNLNLPANKFQQASGSTSSLSSDYLAPDLGCSAYAGGADATFSFSLTTPTKVALDTAGSTIGTSLSLFSAAPTAPTYTPVTTFTNDTLGAGAPFDMGPINGVLKAYSSTTNSVGITANYTSVQLGCSPADNSPDATYQFSVTGTSARRVRITAEDSALDTVLALTNNGTGTFATNTSYTNNDKESSNPATIAMDGKTIYISGNTNTSSYATDYTGSTYDPAGSGCNASGRDAVFKFSLASTKTIQIDTDNAGTLYDTTLGLFRSSITPAAVVNVAGSTAYDTGLTSYLLSPINATKYIVSGSTTTGMVADYADTTTGSCGAVTASPDAVYKLHFSGATRVRLDTIGSGFDTVVSLHSALPDQVPTSLAGGTDTVASVYAIGNLSNRNAVFNQTSAMSGFAANYQVNDFATCSAHDLGPDAVLSFSVGTTGTYQIDTIGSGFDTVLGIYPTTGIPTLPTALDKTTNGDKLTTMPTSVNAAVDVGTIDNNWKSFIGNYSTLGDDNDFMTSAALCGTPANAGGRDVYYKFFVASARTVRIDTIGSAYDGVLGLFRASDNAMLYCNDNGANPGDLITATNLPMGNYYVVMKGKTNLGGGAYKITFRDTTLYPASYCDDNGGGSNTSKITASLTAGTNYYAVIKAKTSTAAGTYKLAIKHIEYANTNTALSCNDNASGTTTDSQLEYDIPAAGDYYAVVKGKSGANVSGNYVLTVQDVTTLPTGFIACNDNGTSVTTTGASSITQTLGAGTYWVMVKGRTGGSPGTKGAFVLNMRDTSVVTTNVLACDYNSGSGGTSAIETDLNPGTYKVVVKGHANLEKNTYKLQVRDVTALPLGSNRLNCDYQSGAGSKSYMETQLNAGTYTVVLKGDSLSPGSYRLSVRDADHAGTLTPVYCDDDSGTGSTSSVTATLGAGTYYVGVKGKTATDVGQYQVHFGGGAQSTTQVYAPKTYYDVVSAMTAKKAHVIPILSCIDDPTNFLGIYPVRADCANARTQYETLATATDSMDAALHPLVFDIHSDGSGLSKTVVDAVNSLAHYLEMDVSVRVVFDPDANPGFGVVVKAVDTAGDGCGAPINNVHQDCTPGATPRFEISFTNPLSAPVPLNSLAKDPKGGYNFRAELIGNEQFIVDQVPIYIIPKSVVNVPVPQVYASGSYTQNLAGSGCTGKTDLPDWNELTWDATIPSGTSVSFSACSGASPAALATCTPTPVCTITGGGACSASSPCPSDSLCSSTGNCWKITGRTCTDNSQCTGGSTCMAGTCNYPGQPVDVGEVLGAQNYQRNLRVVIGLTANTTVNVAPIVHDWQINYLCKSSL